MQKIITRRTITTNLLDTGNLHPLLKQIYAARGINQQTDIETGLEYLLPYNHLKNIDAACACLYEALKAKQHILIVGDFDADGATSTALAISALKCFGAAQVSYLVPNRFEYGYGLTPEIVEVAAKQKPDLIITVDNGISSLSGVAHANTLGIKVLVTDHHLPGTELPQAIIINPNQPDDNFTSKNAAGVGVIFYVMLALRSYLRNLNWFTLRSLPEPNMAQFLDLVALGTVADVVPLDKNNRILVRQGLNRIKEGKARPGIQALLDVAGRAANRLTAADLAFAAAPRLNAAGRLDDMSLGIECLLAKDINSAREMAVQLDVLNKERQAIEADMQQQAFSVLTNLRLTQNLPLGVCLHDPTWHQGVVGIVASRVKDQLHRPVIAFASINDQELKGSARSITGVHIRDVLEGIASKYPGLISKFGGHAMAAGLSLPIQNYQEFAKVFAEEINLYVTHSDLQGKIFSDGELHHDYFNITVAELLREAGPWGQAFPEPIFDNHFEIIEQRLVGSKHLKLTLCLAETGQLIDGIHFNIDTKIWPNYRIKKVRAAYRLDINEFRGRKSVQLLIEHLEVIV